MQQCRGERGRHGDERRGDRNRVLRQPGIPRATVAGRNPFRTTLKPWETMTFVGIYSELFFIPGFFGWWRILSIHSRSPS